FALLALAVGSLATLSYSHLSGMAIPGCGSGSDCDQATRSVWGTIPGIGWPVSHVGLAFFTALLITWVSSPAISAGFRNAVRIGGLMSLLYTFVLVSTGLACKYCLAAHAANFVFWILVEWRARAVAMPYRSLATLMCTFVVVMLGLVIAEA